MRVIGLSNLTTTLRTSFNRWVNRRHSFAILSGIMIGTSFIPYPPWAAMFGLVPLWIGWQKASSWKTVFWQGWITQFILTLIGFHWIAYTAHEFGRMPWILSALVMIAFCCVATLYVPVAGVIWFFLKQRLKLSLIASLFTLSVVTCFAELWVPTIFPWNYGYTWLWIDWPIFQTTEWFGFQGLSCWMILINGVIAWGWIGGQKRKSLITAFSVFAVLSAAGFWLELNPRALPEKAKFLLVQANVGNLDKIYAEVAKRYREEITSRYVRLTEAALKTDKPDFVLWPETAFPEILSDPYNSQAAVVQLKGFIKSNKIHLLTGAYGEDKQGLPTNSFYFLGPDAQPLAPHYNKTHLLAFGEYLPGSHIFPFIKKLVPFVGEFGRGPGPQVGEVKGYRFGPQICYESLFPYFSIGLAKQNAQFILNVTNDSWFGAQEARQHLYMTLARGVETRRPVIRATNTGITTAILSTGEVLQKSPRNQEWAGFYEIPYEKNPELTLFTRYPYLMFYILGLSLIALLGRSILKQGK